MEKGGSDRHGLAGIRNPKRLPVEIQHANHYGLSEYLSGICDMKDAIYRTNWPNTSIIPAGYEAPNPLQLLDTPAMEELIEQLAGQFDVVLIDTPPVGVLVDAVALAKFCDGALLVVGYCKGNSRRSRMQSTVSSKQGVKCWGRFSMA